MTDFSKPITFLQHFQLSDVDIEPSSIGFETVTLESERFICVRRKAEERSQLVIVDLADTSNVLRPLITADSAIMHPKEKIIALRATGQRQLQIFNIETKTKVKSHLSSENIVFWKWISDTTIGLITETAVYHWTIADSTSAPQKIFDRHEFLVGYRIVNYRVSPDEKWLALVGLVGNTTVPNAFKTKGTIQLYSREGGVSHIIDGHAASFAQMTLEGAPAPATFFIVAVRTAHEAKLRVFEIDHNAPTPVSARTTVDIYFPPEAINDSPVGIQVSNRHGVIFLVTKYGFIHLYDLETGTCIYVNRICGSEIFVTAQHDASSGIIVANKSGQVLSVSINDQTVVSYLRDVLDYGKLAFKIASRARLSECHPGAAKYDAPNLIFTNGDLFGESYLG